MLYGATCAFGERVSAVCVHCGWVQVDGRAVAAYDCFLDFCNSPNSLLIQITSAFNELNDDTSVVR